MMPLRKSTNGHAKQKCPIDEALEALAREAEEVIEAVRERQRKREARSAETD